MSDNDEAVYSPPPVSLFGRLSSMLRVAVFFAETAVLLPAIAIAAILTRGRSYWFWALLWSTVSMKVLGMRLVSEGRDKLKPGCNYVVASNHKSLLDPFSVVLSLGPGNETRWVGKRELLKIPVFGFTLKVTGMVMIDRTDHRQAVAEIARMRGEEGISVAFFPEGERAPGDELLPFKKGAAAFAIDSGWPLLPVAVSGSNKALPKHSLVLRPGTIRVRIGEPIETGGLSASDRVGLTERLQASIDAMLGELGK